MSRLTTRQAIVPLLGVLAALGGTPGPAQTPEVDHGSCANMTVDELASPDGRLKAVLFVRGCGEPARFSTQVALLKPSRPLGNLPGNVFLCEGHLDLAGSAEPGVVRLEWAAADRLIVHHPSDLTVYMAKKKLKGVRVTYRTDGQGGVDR